MRLDAISFGNTPNITFGLGRPQLRVFRGPELTAAPASAVKARRKPGKAYAGLMVRRVVDKLSTPKVQARLGVTAVVAGVTALGGAVMANPILRGALSKLPATLAEKPGYTASMVCLTLAGGLLAKYLADEKR